MAVLHGPDRELLHRLDPEGGQGKQAVVRLHRAQPNSQLLLFPLPAFAPADRSTTLAQGYKAAHAPFQPSPWYKDYWSPSWPAMAPRPPSWNCSMESRAKHHPNIASQYMLTDDVASCIDDCFKNRWRTLMSVDDAIKDTIEAVDQLGQSNNTYFLYSSEPPDSETLCKPRVGNFLAQMCCARLRSHAADVQVITASNSAS